MRLDQLEQELRSRRREPEIDFARRLDEWAEAGFPRESGLGPGNAARSGALRRLWDRISSTPPRRLLIPAGAVATAAVIAGVAISTGDRISGGSDEVTSSSAPSVAEDGAASGGAGAGGGGGGRAAQPPQSNAAAGPDAAAPPASEEYNLQLPRANQKPAPRAPQGLAGSSSGGGVARGTDDRIVDATAQVTLGADADHVQDVANGVVEVTDRYDGVVSTSEVTKDQGGARASFELEIPYKHLDAALADLSGLADVISRTEGGKDITAHAVRAQKSLARILDQIRQARIDLIRADTHTERLVIKSRIASLQANADAEQAQLNGVKRQGRFATVGVTVTSGGVPSSGDDGDWSLGDALHDAGRVLEVIGGIALISLAILLPLSLVAALAAYAITRTRRRAREKTLDG